jgi:hypothetical protein
MAYMTKDGSGPFANKAGEYCGSHQICDNLDRPLKQSQTADCPVIAEGSLFDFDEAFLDEFLNDENAFVLDEQACVRQMSHVQSGDDSPESHTGGANRHPDWSQVRAGRPQACPHGSTEEMEVAGFVGLYLIADRTDSLPEGAYEIPTPDSLKEPV